MSVTAMFRDLWSAVANQVSRGKLDLAAYDAGGQRTMLQGNGLAGEIHQGVELLLPYGMSAIPVGSTADYLMFQVNAARDHKVAIGADDPALRIPGLAAGEIGFRNVRGSQVVFRNNQIEVTAPLDGINVTAALGTVTVTGAGVTLQGTGTADASATLAGPAVSIAAATVAFGGLGGEPTSVTINGEPVDTGGGSTVSIVIESALFLNSGTIGSTGTITDNPSFAAQSLAGNAQTIAGPAGPILVGSNLAITPSGTLGGAGTLSANSKVVINSALFLNSATVSSSGTITDNPSFAASSIAGNAQTVAGPAGPIGLAANLSLTPSGTIGGAGTLSVVTGGSGGVGAINTLVAGAGMFVNAGTPGGTIVTTGTFNIGEFVNAQSGASYTIAAGDQAKLVDLTYTLGGVAHLATANYATGFVVELFNGNGSYPGSVIPSSGTINGGSTLYLTPYQGARIVFDGTNYEARTGSPFTLTASSALVCNAGGISIGSLNTGFSSTSDALAIGSSNTVDNNGIAVGNANKLTGANAAALGASNSASEYSTSIGYGGSDNGTQGSFTQGFSDSGALAQRQEVGFYAQILGGTANTRLVSIGGSAGASNVGVVPFGSTAGFELRIHVHDKTNGGSVDFIYGNGGVNIGQIANPGSTAATVAIASGGTFSQSVTIGSIQAIGTPSLTVDTTLGAPAVYYQPGVGNTATLEIVALWKLLQS